MTTRNKLPKKYLPYLAENFRKVGFTVGALTAHAINVILQLKDDNGKAYAGSGRVRCYLARDSAGLIPVQSPPDTSIINGTYGAITNPNPNALNGVTATATLIISATATAFKTTATTTYTIGGKTLTKAATDPLTFTAAHVVTGSKFGIILVQINAAGTISTKVPAATPTTAMAYNSAALAYLALPAPDAGNVALGCILITAAGGGFTGNTTALTGISTFTQVVLNGTIPISFDLTFPATGLADITITDNSGLTPAMYLSCVMPDGTLQVSTILQF